MGSSEEVEKMVKDWFMELAADFYDAGIQKLVTRYGKCHESSWQLGKKNYLRSVVMM
jgi:hypothetical protein